MQKDFCPSDLLHFEVMLFFFLLDLQLLSPISIHDRYNSPMAGSAKRRLFGDESPPTKSVEKRYAEGIKLKTDKHMSVSPDEIALSMAQTTVTRQKVTIPLHGRYETIQFLLDFLMANGNGMNIFGVKYLS